MRKNIACIALFIIALATTLFPAITKAQNQVQIYIDYPTQNQTCNNELYVHGWFMSAIANKTLRFYIDNNNQEVTNNVQRYDRPDVTKSITGYGTPEQNPLAGYKGTINIDNIKDGRHTLIIQTVDNETGNVIGSATRAFNVKKYKTSLNIDYPKANSTTNNTLYVHGWVMSELKDKDVKVYIDDSNVETKNSIQRYNRPDVTNAIKGYGTAEQNPLAGYKGNVELPNTIRDGKHKVTVKVINPTTQEIMEQATREFYVQKYKTSLNIDYPRTNQYTQRSVYVHGWVMSELADKDVKVYIDNENNDVTSSIQRYNRPDVINAIKGYGTAQQNPLAGYKGTVDVSNVKDGWHNVIVKVINRQTNEIMQTSTSRFYVEKYKTQICIDYPQNYSSYRNTLSVHGWIMSEQANKTVRFYLNGNDITNSIRLYDRPDVTNSIQGYGSRNENPHAGFDGQINVSGYSAGEYRFKVEVYSNKDNEILQTQENIVKLNEITYEEGTYGISGLKVQHSSWGNELRYYKIGNGNNVMFAVFSVHGFEDGWHKDGSELSYIADRFRDELRNNSRNYRDVLNNWTIYIIPAANSDGQYYGWDNNGSGRTTLYSAAPNHQGIDMNRCWSVGYTRRTSSREYNGTAPFQAYESRYLRDFLVNRRAANGRTILVDLHGWLNETIGDNGLGSYYRSSLGMSTHISSYGGGYLINWARSLPNTRSTLVELPVVRNHTELVNRDFAGKYIRATINMLRNN